jgi:DNA-binding CsgD family transcriptional regulator
VPVRPHRLVGREEELGALIRLLDAPDELPAAAVVVGEAGIGKTALWLTATEEAAARRYLVLSCRPSEAEARFSFSGLADLLGEHIAEVLPELAMPQRSALETALGISSSGPVEERLVAFAFLNALRRLAEGNRVVAAVDDVQCLDGPSASLLRYALSRLETEPVLALLTARGEVPSWLGRIAAERRLLELELGPLSVGALHELLRSRVDVAFPRPVLLRIWETSGGNPFFALELARALQRRGGSPVPGEELPLPPSLGELVHERLESLSAPAREVVRAVAALAEPTVTLVEAAAGPEADVGLADALEAGLLQLDGDRLRFAHPLLGSAVSARATPAERRSLHQRLAELVPGAEERARHLALAAAGPGREAASALEEAAQAAHARGAPAAAAELAEQAWRLTPAPDSQELSRRALVAADRLRDAGDSRRAIAVLEQARASAPPGSARATVLMHLVQPTWDASGPREALVICEEALAEAEGDDAVEATVRIDLADLMRGFVEGASSERGLEHAELAVAASRRAGNPALMCRALAMFGLLHFIVGRGVPRAEMEEALALERSLGLALERSLGASPVAEATWVLAHQLTWSGEDRERARHHLHAYRKAIGERQGLEERFALWWLSLVEWRAGNWDLAARYAADMLVLAAQAGYEAERPIFDLAAAAIAAHQGRVEEARARAGDALRLAEKIGSRLAQALHFWVLGFIELSLDNPGAGLANLRQAWEIYDELDYFEPGHRLELADTLEALIAVGELDEAERRLGPWEKRARKLDRAWAIAVMTRCRALLLAARGDFAGSLAAFDEALAEHSRSVYPFEHGRTLLALGTTQRRARQRGTARATLEQALGIFEDLGAPLWSDKARSELARIGGRAPSRGELTESERRIAALVAEGSTNREVAAALFLTEHTVETALTRVYRKLGVRSRAELAGRLARETKEPPLAKS